MSQIIGAYKLNFLDILGTGAVGQVYKGEESKTGNHVAVKRVAYIKNGNVTQVLANMGRNEMAMFQELKGHPNVVELLHYEDDGKNHWLVMEYCDLGDLQDYMLNHTPDMTQRLKIMYEATKAISHMHSRQPAIVHRDIKPSNILMTKEGHQHVAKITDFGVGKLFEAHPNAIYQTLTSKAGTPAFWAPEFSPNDETGLRYKSSVDIFSLGLLFHVILNYETDNKMIPTSVECLRTNTHCHFGVEMAHAVKNELPLPILFPDPNDDSVTCQVQSLITDMIKCNPTERPKPGIVKQRIAGIYYELADMEKIIATLKQEKAVIFLSNETRKEKVHLEVQLSQMMSQIKIHQWPGDSRVYNSPYEELLKSLPADSEGIRETFRTIDCHRISLVNGDIWIPLQWKRQIQIVNGDTINIQIVPWCITQTKTNEILIGSSQGIYVADIADIQCVVANKVCDGNIYNIFLCSENRAIAYDDNSHSVLTCQYNNSKWQCRPLVSLKGKTTKGNTHTLVSHNETIHVVSTGDNTILSFNLKGEHINTISTVSGVSGPSSLKHPYISGIDSQGSLIICDTVNHRILVYSVSEWTEYKHSRFPFDVVFTHDTFHVFYWKCEGVSVLKTYPTQ